MSLSEHYAGLRRKVGHSLLLVPAVAAVIRNEGGEVLLQQKQDGSWSLPSGAIEPGETPAQALVREVKEETGLRAIPEQILGIFGGSAGFRFDYPNGDAVEYTVILFECRVEGLLGTVFDAETEALMFFPADELPKRLALGYPQQIFRERKTPAAYFEPATLSDPQAIW